MKKILTIISLLLLANHASACTGYIKRVQLTKTGAVELIAPGLYKTSSGSDDTTGHTICNMSVEWKGVTPETCRGWYSLVLSSIAQNKRIKMQIDSCTQEPWGRANAPHMLSNYN